MSLININSKQWNTLKLLKNSIDILKSSNDNSYKKRLKREEHTYNHLLTELKKAA